MKKILFITPGIGIGGAERQLALLAKEINKRGFYSQILPLSYDPNEENFPDFKNLELVDFQIRKNKINLKEYFRLRDFIKKEQPDIIQGWMYAGNIAASVLTLGLKKKIFHSIRASDMDNRRYGKQIMFSKYISKYVKKVILNSQAGYDFHKKIGFEAENMLVIPNGIDTKIFKPDPNLRKKMRNKLGISAHKKVVIFVARLDPMKSHQKVLEIAYRHPDLLFLFVGFRTKNIIAPNNVLKLGLCNEMNSVYNSADIMVHFSNYGEGFPNVIGEAMACGIPVLANDIGDNKHIIGKTGLIETNLQLEKLDKHINILLNISKQIAKKNKIRERIVYNFSVSKMVESYIKLYN